MNDLVAWLSTQLDEDERVAHGVPEAFRTWERSDSHADDIETDGGAVVADYVPLDGPISHMVRWDPARVLAEIAATRAVVQLHVTVVLHGPGAYFDTRRVCKSCEPPKQFPELATPCPTLRALALPYRDRPGYRPEWAPEPVA